MEYSKIQNMLKDYFCKRDEIAFAILFGSFAKETAHQKSDVDIAVLFEDSPSEKDIFSMQSEISILCGREVDLVDLAKAEGVFLSQIMTSGIRIKPNKSKDVYYSLKSIYFHEDFLPIVRSVQQEKIRRFIDGR